jgi:glutathione S-transferase
MYLKERGIPNTIQLAVDHLYWPVLKHGENSVMGTLKIMSYLEQTFPVDVYPKMIPCTTSTKSYQKYIFYSSLIDNTDLTALSLGLINNPNIRSDAQMKINLEKLKKSLEMCLETELALTGNINLFANYIFKSIAGEISKMASSIKQSFTTSENKETWDKLLQEVNKDIDRFEEELQNQQSPQNGRWMIAGMFSALDISFGVFLFSLHQLGLLGQILAEKPGLQAFWRLFMEREHTIVVCQPTMGLTEGCVTVDSVGSSPEYNISIDDSSVDEEVSQIFQHDSESNECAVETKERKKMRRKKQHEDRTWYSLW